MTPTERARRLARARRRKDVAAQAILEGGRTYTDDPVTPVLRLPWVGRGVAA